MLTNLTNLIWHWVIQKKTWDIIKNITLGCDNVISQSITEIKVDNNLITGSNIMANKFN